MPTIHVLYGKSGKWKKFDSKVKAAKFAVKHPLASGVIPKVKGPVVMVGSQKLSQPQVRKLAKKKIVRRRQTRGFLNF